MLDDLLLVPGPTTLSSRVREVLARPQIGHSSQEFYEAFLDLLRLTKYAFRTEGGHPFVITGSGTVAMEAAVASLIEPDDRVLVLDTGPFGNRFHLMLEAHGAKSEVLKFAFGRHADPGLVGERLSRGDCKAIFMTHVDTSATVQNPLDELIGEAKRQGVLTVVDSICGVGGLEFEFDKLGVDVAITASQKALAAPPGAGLLVLSDRALKVMEDRKGRIRSYYFDLLRWKRVMEDPRVYLATPSVQIMLALREALMMVKEEGLEKRWRRHRLIAEAFRAGMEASGMKFVAEEGYRADTVTGIYVPDGKAGDLQSVMARVHSITMARGLYEHRDEMVRVAHLGNIMGRDSMAVLSALEMSLRALGFKVGEGAMVNAALSHIEDLVRTS